MRNTRSSSSRAAVYRRRRLGVVLVGAGAVSLSVLGACNVLADPGGGPASAAGIRPAVDDRTIVVRPGDTIWEISQRVYAAEGDDSSMPFADYVDAVVRRNGTQLRPGDVVVLP